MGLLSKTAILGCSVLRRDTVLW